jgi:hypothetical protein
VVLAAFARVGHRSCAPDTGVSQQICLRINPSDSRKPTAGLIEVYGQPLLPGTRGSNPNTTGACADTLLRLRSKCLSLCPTLWGPDVQPLRLKK